MKATDLRQKSTNELKETLTSLLRDQLKLRLSKQGDGEFTQNHKFKVVRRSIARVLTIMTAKKKEGNA